MAECEETVKVGEFIVIQRQEFFKLHKVSENGSVSLGKDVIDLSSIIGKRLWTTYRMEQKKEGKRNYVLTECKPEEISSLNVSIESSGSDNRNICDDGSSQKLTMEEIVNLRDEGLSSKEILGTLIENSKTFHSKTEYSQQKYLKKKAKKYFEFISIRKPSVRLIAEILFRQDPGKILGLRMDTLSQIPTAVNLHPHGSYILFESGCQSLPAAMLLNGLAGDGKLIHVHPGSHAQRHALNAMNLTDEQKNSCVTVNINLLLQKLKNDSVVPETKISSMVGDSVKAENVSDPNPSEEIKCDMSPDVCSKTENVSEKDSSEVVSIENASANNSVSNQSKRKYCSGEEDVSNKRPRYEVDSEIAANIVKSKVDGLVIVCREHPGNILKALIPYVAPSRNFVVYCSLREPLQELLLELKQRPDVIYLRLTDTWLRNYQVDTNRTHPLVNMTGSGGFLLTGVVVEKPVD